VDDASVRQDALRGALTAADIGIVSLRHTRPRMEEAFVSLVRKQMEDAVETVDVENAADEGTAE
jgi:hypothetical protein